MEARDEIRFVLCPWERGCVLLPIPDNSPDSSSQPSDEPLFLPRLHWHEKLPLVLRARRDKIKEEADKWDRGIIKEIHLEDAKESEAVDQSQTGSNSHKDVLIQWAKNYTNLILTREREGDVSGAVSMAERFQRFIRSHPSLENLESIGGNLGRLAEALVFALRMCRVKEGAIRKGWQPPRILAEYRKMLQERSYHIRDDIFIGTSMETLYTLTANLVAWLESHRQFEPALEVMQDFLSYLEAGLVQGKWEATKGDSVFMLAASFYRYLHSAGKHPQTLYPHMAGVYRRYRIPYSALGRIYRPRIRVTETDGFYTFISRRLNHRQMAWSISASLGMIGIIVLVMYAG